MNRAVSRTGRTFLQLAAAGGLTGLVAAVASGLGAWAATIVLALGTLTATFAQNWLEAKGTVDPILEDAPAAEPTDWVGRRLATGWPAPCHRRAVQAVGDDEVSAADCPRSFVLRSEGGVKVVWACGAELVSAGETAVDVAVLADRYPPAHSHHRHRPKTAGR